MQIKDLLERYDVIADVLEREYGILLARKQKQTACFSRLELNITFATEHSFLTYFRYFKLLSYAILKKGGTVNLTATVDNLRKAYEYETIKCDRSTYGIRIYNKGREISKKLKLSATYCKFAEGRVFIQKGTDNKDGFWGYLYCAVYR